jgi:hypothetical protein
VCGVIFSALISLFLNALTWLLGLLPTTSIPSTSGLTSAINSSSVWQYVGWVNHYFPVDTLVTLVGLRWAWLVGEVGWKFILWALTKAHVLGGAD